MKSRIREIGSLNHRIALKFDNHISSGAVEVPVKFSERPDNSKYKSRDISKLRDQILDFMQFF